MAVNYKISEASIVLTGGVTVGDQPVNPYVDLIISNWHGGKYNLSAEKFCIGGAVKVVDPQLVDLPSGQVWEGGNVDIEVKNVHFSDIGNPGTTTNRVRARVYFKDLFIPTAITKVFVDIDEIDEIIDYDGCNSCLITNWKSNPLQTVTVNEVVRPKMKNTLMATLDGSTQYLHEGSNPRESYMNPIAHISFDRVGVADFTTLYHAYDQGGKYPSVSFKQPYAPGSNTASGCWPDLNEIYSYEIIPRYTLADITKWTGESTSRSNSLLYGFDVLIYYRPDSCGTKDCEDLIATAGHTAEISYDLFTPSVVVKNKINHLSYKNYVAHWGGSGSIRVHGSVGAKYKIGRHRKESLTSTTTAATGGYYSFYGGRFLDTSSDPQGRVVSLYEDTIGASGSNLHPISFPPITTVEDYRYDIVLQPAGVVPSVFADSIPTIPGDASIIQYGFKSLTLTPLVIGTESDYGSMPDSQVIKRRGNFAGGSYASKSGGSVSAKSKQSTSGSRVLTLSKVDPRVRVGMRVMMPHGGNGIPHLTTVVNVNKDIITLSAVCTIAAQKRVLFVSKTSDVIPFSFTIPPNVKSLTPNNVRTEETVAGLDATVTIKTSASVGDSSTLTTTSGATKLLKSGMKLSAKNKGVTGTPLIASVTDTTIVLQGDNQTFSGPQELTFEAEYANPSVSLYHVQADQSGSSVKIQGYINAAAIDNTAVVNILVDSLVTATS